MTENYSQEYMPIDIQHLRVESLTNFDVFIKHGREQNNYLLYCPAGGQFSVKIQKKLVEYGINILYVHTKDKKAYEEYLTNNLQNMLQDNSLTTEKKSEIVYKACVRGVEEVYLNPKAPIIEKSKETMRHTVDYIVGANRDSVKQMIMMIKHDQRTYVHSVNVGMLGVSLAKEVLDKSEEELYEIGYGMFLHDIGKTRIGLEILNKPERLSEEEWEVIKTHPQKGFDILSEEGHLSPECQTIMLQHHERCNGKGYPKALKSHEIDPLGKICNIVDSYDALLAKRAYKGSMTPFEALKIMKDEMLEQYDQKLFEKFVLLLN